MNPFFNVENLLERVDLDLIKVMVQQRLNKHSLHGIRDVDVGRYFDHMTQEVAFQFEAFVLGKNQKPIELPCEPTSWWQMFKRDLMPRWFVKRFPVKSSIRVIDVKVFYPDLDIKIPSHMSRVTVVLQPRFFDSACTLK